jgi:hypothetical protein
LADIIKNRNSIKKRKGINGPHYLPPKGEEMEEIFVEIERGYLKIKELRIKNYRFGNSPPLGELKGAGD